MQILTTVLSISVISSILAIMIIIAEKYLNNYGQCTITINETKKLEVQGGSSLLSSLAAEKIFVPSACGGKGTCGYCKVKVIDGAGPLLPTETPYLSAEELKNGVRLSCQIKVKNNINIKIPEELFSIKQFRASVSSITKMTHDIKAFRFKLLDPAQINYRAGQYVQISTKPYDKVQETVSRAYSMSSVPSEKDVVELIVRLVPGGICTTYMHNHLREGDEVKISGPYGDFYIREDADEYVFIAGGSGLAPIKSMVYDILEKKLDKNMIFFFGAVSKKDLYHVELFNELAAKNSNFRYVPALSKPAPEDNWQGETGLITEVVARYTQNAVRKHAYLCGSPGMINACINVLKEKGFNDETIFFDKF